MHAKQPGGLGDRQGRVRWSGGKGGRHGSLRKCEVDAPSLPISQFLPIGRWSQPRSRAAAGRQPHVGEGRDDATRARWRPPRAARTADRRRGRVPGPSCAGRRRSASGLGDAARVGSRDEQPATSAVPTGATAPGRAVSAVTRPPRRRPAIRRRRRSPRPTARQRRRDQRSPRAAVGQEPHRLVGFERGQDERPAQTGRQSRLARLVQARDAEDDRVLDRRDLFDAEPDRRRPRASRAGRDRGRRPRCRPIRGARRRARHRGRRRRRRCRRGRRGPRRGRAPGCPRRSPSPSSRRTWSRVRRKTSGRWASSSNSSSASIRPPTRT